MSYLFFTKTGNQAAASISSDLSKSTVNAEFLSTDPEIFCSTHDLSKYSGVVNLDLCGYGDTIVFTVRGKKSAFTRFFTDKAQYLRYLPEGSEVSVFRKFRLSVLTLAIVPRWDVQYLKALASLGHTPEFDMILSQMEVSSKTHESDPKAMKQVYDYLYEAMTLPEVNKSFLRRIIEWITPNYLA